jgi:hypothetical protein
MPKPRSEIATYWKILMGDVFPDWGDPVRLADAYRLSLGEPGLQGKANHTAVWMRNILSQSNNVVPRPETAVTIARAARSLGHAWFADALALFAAGAFADFVYLFDWVMREKRIPTGRLADLIKMTARASRKRIHPIQETALEHLDSLQQQPHTTDVKKQMRAAKAQVKAIELEARNRGNNTRDCWTLTSSEQDAFASAWANRCRGEEIAMPVLQAAALAERYPLRGLDFQQRMVLVTLLVWITHQDNQPSGQALPDERNF